MSFVNIVLYIFIFLTKYKINSTTPVTGMISLTCTLCVSMNFKTSYQMHGHIVEGRKKSVSGSDQFSYIPLLTSILSSNR